MRKSTISVCLAGVAILGVAMAATAAQRAHKDDNDPDILEIRHYRLTMDKIEKVADASDAVNKMLASNPALKKQVDAETETDNTSNIDQKAKELDAKFPQIAAVVHGHGVTTREYLVINFALLNDMMIVGMKKQGAIKSYPAGMITPENAAFVEQNYDKLTELTKKMSPPDAGNQN